MAILEADQSDPLIGRAHLLDGTRLLAKQYRALQATEPSSPVRVLALFGAWRAGKTSAQQLCAISLAIQNPWTKLYGKNRPCTLMVTETVTVLRDSLYDALINIFPEGLITREVRSPAWDLDLPNGHVIALRTDAGALEGKTVCNTVVDEIHKISSKRNYLNYRARASDSRAAKNMVIVAGLPLDNGWIREEFDREQDPTRLTLYMPTAENAANLPPGYLETMLSSMSASEAKTLLRAEWQTFEGAIYDELDTKVHFVDDNLRPAQPVHIGLDAGHQAAIVVLQERERRMRDGTKARGAHVVDEILVNSSTVEHAMNAFFARGWKLEPGKSYVCCDPRVDDDQLESIRRSCREHGIQGISIVQWSRGEPGESVKYGIRCVKAALKRGDGSVLLTFDSSLKPGGRGLRFSLPKYRWNPRTRDPVKDDAIDHVLDALRYGVVQLLPLDGRDVTVMPGFH